MRNSIEKIYGSYGCLVGTLALVLVLALWVGVFLLEGWIFMLLWNWLAVSLFSAAPFGYWISVGIILALHFIKNLFSKMIVVTVKK